MVEINNLEDMLKVIGNYNIPINVLLDVDNRIKDWLASGGKEDDNYIINQCKYIERIINNMEEKQNGR